MLRLRAGMLGMMLVALGAGAGCGSEPPPKVAEAPPPEPKKEEPEPPKCKHSDPDHPADIEDVKKGFKKAVGRCWMLGGHGDMPDEMRVHVKLSEDGTVGEVMVQDKDAIGNKSAVTCCEAAFRKITFEKFCGDDVEMILKYRLKLPSPAAASARPPRPRSRGYSA